VTRSKSLGSTNILAITSGSLVTVIVPAAFVLWPSAASVAAAEPPTGSAPGVGPVASAAAEELFDWAYEPGLFHIRSAAKKAMMSISRTGVMVPACCADFVRILH
jgi:hypothetical protein